MSVAGLTTFPKLGFAVKPVKGSAVLWYTNTPNGPVDKWTLHGACPLISGHKWSKFVKYVNSGRFLFERNYFFEMRGARNCKLQDMSK